MDIQKTYELAFAVEDVFAAWISDDFNVAPVTSTEVEPEVGGVFRLKIGADGGTMEGNILEIVPNEKLRYTWHWGGPGEPSIVDVQFAEVDNQTAIIVSHTGLDTPEVAAQHEDGWDSYVNGLVKLLKK